MTARDMRNRRAIPCVATKTVPIGRSGTANAGASPVTTARQDDREHAEHEPAESSGSVTATLTDAIQAEAEGDPELAGTMRAGDAASTDDRDDREWTVEVGANVIGTCGHKVGEVVTVRPHHIVVEKGFFMPTDFYVPKSAIVNIDDHGLYLNVTKEYALHHGWDIDPDLPAHH